MDKCPCRSCKPGDIRDRGLLLDAALSPTVPTVFSTEEYTETPKFGGYDFALVVTCGLTRVTRVFPCTKHITGEGIYQRYAWKSGSVSMGHPKRLTQTMTPEYAPTLAWYKRVLRSLNVHVSTGIPYYSYE